MNHFDDVLVILAQSDTRLSARAAIRKIKETLSVSSRCAKKILQTLVNEQELAYHYLYGTTYVEKNFLKPVQISPHFILHPPGFLPSAEPEKIPIALHQGISFGSGQHPTTQMCLEGIDFSFFNHQHQPLSPSLGADIGTGSGVLALALCRCGIQSCHAHEIDPVSLNEAEKNISLNHLEDQILLTDTLFQEKPTAFSIICANLRWPTLKSLSSAIYNSLKKKGLVILSGVRVWEKQDLLDEYTRQGFKLLWQTDKNQWAAFVLIK